jgi:transcriptional regulator with PAS, ATPase and Fis domain
VIGGLILLTPLEESTTLVNQVRTSPQKNSSYTFADVIGNHPAILEAKHLAQLATSNLAKVLLQGECGTGKEIFAQAIHHQSPRRAGPFVAVNCGAIPKELVGSELFGYEEGAFTGARRGGKAGKFELAHGGTLFFDEIGDMPVEQQVVLLRVLQEQKVTRLGGHREIPVDVRIICATNKHLFSEVMHGRFREDLYYRLNVITIQIPPLRERKEDIILLFTHFLRSYELLQGQAFTIEPDVFEYLQNYPWPGNVRELKNVVERVASLTQDHTVRVGSLPPEIRMPGELRLQETALSARYVSHFADRQARKQERANVEKQEITYMLDTCHGNVSRAARELGMSRNTLYRKMRLYGIVN